MLETIEKLLILQERDRKLQRIETELASSGPEKNALQNQAKQVQAALEAAKLHSKQIESERKRLELEAESIKARIDKYSTQQLQTKKNDEYKALSHEIENCKVAISKLEDEQLELMEKLEAAQKLVAEANRKAVDDTKHIDAQQAELAQREEFLNKQLADLRNDHATLKAAVDEAVLERYNRLRKTKGGNAVVGIQHSVCGGCHMKLPVQIVLSCQNGAEVVQCTNCGRLLYFTPDMDLTLRD